MDRTALRLGVRPADLITVTAVIAVIELNVAVGGGTGAVPLNAEAYVIGAVISLPLLLARRWPLPILFVSFALMVGFYWLDRRNISPAPLMFVPTYECALAGYLAWAIGLPALIMVLGVIWVGVLGHEQTVVLLWDFLPSLAIFVFAVALGEVVRSRRALAAETARRLQLADHERRSDAARILAEERLRIARELHDTVATSMATIALQAGSALHLISHDPGRDRVDAQLRDSLSAIRDTSKGALAEMRTVLGQIRAGSGSPAVTEGLSRLPQLCATITAAGTPVTVALGGKQEDLPPAVDHAAYRILQESLTNVLRHAPAGTPAEVGLRYTPDAVTITVTNDGPVPDEAVAPDDDIAGNGIRGMRERAASVGGFLDASPRPGGGFTVLADLPRKAP
ncbi:MAG TPA: sensor histidine kinase [Trebonia sp.]|nr:sensor histidine kinase [Trebonia sp.]